jgi:hypothetical protein
VAYQEIVAPATPAAVIDAIVTFAAANGWTVDRNNLVGSARTATIHRAGSDYLHIYNTGSTDIFLRGSIDYASGTTPDATTRRGVKCRTNCGAGAYTRLYLFADASPSPHIHAILEANVAGMFYHMSFGVIDKLEAFTGGTYYDGTWWYDSATSNMNSYTSLSRPLFDNSEANYATNHDQEGGLRCDFAADARTDAWWAFGYDTNSSSDLSVVTGISASGNLNSLVHMAAVDVNAFSNRSIFHRIPASVHRGSGYFSQIGSFPNVRFCNITKFTPAQEITIGSDTWKVFPMIRKGSHPGGAAAPYSGIYGYAYKKVP